MRFTLLPLGILATSRVQTGLVVGGGPAGLSAALFTQKNGLEDALFDLDAQESVFSWSVFNRELLFL